MESFIEPQDWIAAARQLHQTFEPGDYGELAELLRLLAAANYFLMAQPSIATDSSLLSPELESNREVLLGLANRIVEDNVPGQAHVWGMIGLTYLAQQDRENASIALGVGMAISLNKIDDAPIGWEGIIHALTLGIGEGIEGWRDFSARYLNSNQERNGYDTQD